MNKMLNLYTFKNIKKLNRKVLINIDMNKKIKDKIEILNKKDEHAEIIL